MERLTTWWRIGHSYTLSKYRHRFVLALVWRLPRWLVYWCAIRLVAHATTGRYSDQVVPDLRAMDALERWEKR
jgi:hypothetical protein